MEIKDCSFLEAGIMEEMKLKNALKSMSLIIAELNLVVRDWSSYFLQD